MKEEDSASTRGKESSECRKSDASRHLAAIAKWTKYIASLLVLILLVLVVISGLLLMQLRT